MMHCSASLIAATSSGETRNSVSGSSSGGMSQGFTRRYCSQKLLRSTTRSLMIGRKGSGRMVTRSWRSRCRLRGWLQTSVLWPLTFMAQLPQMAWRQLRRKVSVPSWVALMPSRASSNVVSGVISTWNDCRCGFLSTSGLKRWTRTVTVLVVIGTPEDSCRWSVGSG